MMVTPLPMMQEAAELPRMESLLSMSSVQLSRRDYEHINKIFIPSNVRRIK